MSLRRINDAGSMNILNTHIAPYEYAAVYDYLGKNRYLQASFCKSVQQLYIEKFGAYTTKAISNIAAEEGFIGLLEWSKEIGCRWDESVFASGAKGGNVDILNWLVAYDCPVPDGNAVWMAAAERGYIEVLKFAHESNYLHFDLNMGMHDMQPLCVVAARNGHLNVLKWAYAVEGTRYFHADTCQQAAVGGFIDIIIWLRGVGCMWKGDTCWAAIRSGHVDILAWALDNGCPWTVNDRMYDGSTGLHHAKHVDVIEFLISRGADINVSDNDYETPLYWAAKNNNLPALTTLVASGANVNFARRFDITPLDIAIERGYHEIVEVLRAAGASE